MQLNAISLNGAWATGYRTGDINGPTLVWESVGPLPTTWTKATEPSIVTSGSTRYFLLLALTNGGTATSGVWTAATEPSVTTWSKETV